MAHLTRRDFLSSLACGGLGLVLSTAHGAAAANSRRKPNVVMIVVDDLNDYVTGMGGHPQAKTPHMAKFRKSMAVLAPTAIEIKAFEVAQEVKLPL